MHSPADYHDGLGPNVIDELICRCLDQAAFGTDLDNEENDVPLYDQYNRGLALCQEDLPRESLQLEGGRPGMTGYIPSMEEALEAYPASSPRPKALVMELGAPSPEMVAMSQKRRGISR